MFMVIYMEELRKEILSILKKIENYASKGKYEEMQDYIEKKEKDIRAMRIDKADNYISKLIQDLK